MRIRTKVIIGVVAVSLMASIVIAILVSTTVSLRRLESRRNRLVAMLTSIIELDARVLEYTDNPSETAGDGLAEALEELSERSRALQESPGDSTEAALVDEMARSAGALDAMFSSFIDRSGPDDRAQDLRAASEMLVRSNAVLDNAVTLSNMTVGKLVSAEARETVIVVTAMVLLILFVAGTGTFLQSQVLRSLEKLKRGAGELAGGNLDFRLVEVGQDEIGEVSSSFNDMAERLARSFAERDEEILRRAKAERSLREKNTQLEAFAHTVSHDIRSPLASVGLGSQLLCEALSGPPGEPDRRELLEIAEAVKNGFERASALVDNILLLAEAGNAPVDVEPVDVSGVVKSIISENTGLIERRGMTFLIDEDLGVLRANRTHVYQVFSNLVNNAIKFNDSERPVIEVRYLGMQPDGRRRYRVKDNGPGIPEDELDKVFAPFVKGRKGGTGLGLAIVANLVSMYQGAIRVYNRDGACFEFDVKDFEAHPG